MNAEREDAETVYWYIVGWLNRIMYVEFRDRRAIWRMR